MFALIDEGVYVGTGGTVLLYKFGAYLLNVVPLASTINDSSQFIRLVCALPFLWHSDFLSRALVFIMLKVDRD
jgi:hypothetical protein